MKRLVLLGGGHSHVEVLRRFGSEPVTDVELVLVSPYPDSPYSGMLPGWIAGHYTRDECHIDLARLTRFANCRFVRSACNGINPEARLVFSCGWHISRDGEDRYSRAFRAKVAVMGTAFRLSRMGTHAHSQQCQTERSLPSDHRHRACGDTPAPTIGGQPGT